MRPLLLALCAIGCGEALPMEPPAATGQTSSWSIALSGDRRQRCEGSMTMTVTDSSATGSWTCAQSVDDCMYINAADPTWVCLVYRGPLQGTIDGAAIVLDLLKTPGFIEVKGPFDGISISGPAVFTDSGAATLQFTATLQ